MTLPHWAPRGKIGAGPWDKFRVQNVPLPGLTIDCDCDTSTAVSNAKSKGVNGPRQKSEGYNGGNIRLVQEVTTRAEVEAIDAAFEPLRVTNDDATKTPIRVDHPNLYFHRIEYISSAKVSSGMPKKGRWHVTVDMIQWFPPEEKTKANGTGAPKPDASGPGDTSVPEPDPANLGADFP